MARAVAGRRKQPQEEKRISVDRQRKKKSAGVNNEEGTDWGEFWCGIHKVRKKIKKKRVAA